jgi:hypothetical protein
MRQRVFIVATCLSLLAAGTGVAWGAGSSLIKVRASLNAKQVQPQGVKVAGASGSFSGTLAKTRKGYRLSWRLTFSHLSGKAKSSYIHKGKPGRYGAAYFHLCSPCVSGAHGRAYASPNEVSLMKAGLMYVNIRTPKHPAGEIRGQIRVG